MAKKPTKQVTSRSTETNEIMVPTVDLPKTPEQAMGELTELSQEMGLYDITDNPLINGTPTNSQEVTAAQRPLPIGITISPPTCDAQHVKNGWDKPIPTKVVTIKKSSLHETIREALYLARLGSQLDLTFVPTMYCPFICRMLLPEDKYQDYLEHKSENNYNELQADAYNEILVKAVDRITFWKALIKVGNAGAFIKPNTAPVKNPHFMVKVLTKRPVDATINTQLRVPRAVYTEADMEGFNIDELKIIGGWYNLSFNSKQKYIKAILEAQGS